MGEKMQLYEKIFIAYRAVGIILLYLLWTQTDKGLVGLFLLMLLLILMLLRWRFPKLKWTLLLDHVAVIWASTFLESSSYAFTLSVFEAMYLGSPFYALPVVFYTVMYKPEGILLLLLAQSAFVGMALWGWRNQLKSSFMRMDDERRKHYETDRLKEELLAANVEVARMAELSERSRIARDIHDNAGHEIVAAYMSLQTAEALFDLDASAAEELFHEGLGRLESGIDKIREAVHNLTPLAELGAISIRRLCEKFTNCPVDFIAYGDPTKVSVHLWVILEACVKEALTNIMRHADAKKVTVTLDITLHIIRLCIENDGVKINSGYAGVGLRNLHQRIKAVGGSFSTDMSDCFRMVCVLPCNQEGDQL